MEKYIINGGTRLCGEVPISGAKNAVVAILAATILADTPCVIENIPNISDVSILTSILHEMGAAIKVINKHKLEIDTSRVKNPEVPYEQAKRMSASDHFLALPVRKVQPCKGAASRRLQFRRPSD